jgi:hypothetical protein
LLENYAQSKNKKDAIGTRNWNRNAKDDTSKIKPRQKIRKNYKNLDTRGCKMDVVQTQIRYKGDHNLYSLKKDKINLSFMN